MPKDDLYEGTDAPEVVHYAALAFLHRELTKVDSIKLTKADFDAFELSVSTTKQGDLGIRFSLDAENEGDIVLTAVKKRNDA